MALEARPHLLLNGKEISCSADAIAREMVAVKGLEFKWGRDSYLDGDTTPASLTCHISDATGQLGLWIQTRLIIGKPIEVQYTLHDKDTGERVGNTISMYRGRVQVATARAAGRIQENGAMRFDVELTCADRTADYGNAVERQLKWGREKMIGRANLIRDLGNRGGAQIANVYFWPGYVDTYVRPIEEDGIDGLELLKRFYNSMGNDTYAYDPHSNAIRQAIRFSMPMNIVLRVLDPKKFSVAPATNDFTVDNVRYPSISISSGEIQARDGAPIIASRENSINRLESTYRSRKDNYSQDGWYFALGNVQPGDSVRLYQWHSWIDDENILGATLYNVEKKVKDEGSRPKPPNLVMGPKNSFLSIDEAAWLLQTWENIRPAYIFGHTMNTWLDNPFDWYPPVYGPIGGVTKFDPKRGWSFDINLQQIYNESPGSAHRKYDPVEGDVYFQWRNVPKAPNLMMTWGEAQEGVGPRFADCVSWDDTRVLVRPEKASDVAPIYPARPDK